MLLDLAREDSETETPRIDATRLKTHRRAELRAKEGARPPHRARERRPELEAACGHGHSWPTDPDVLVRWPSQRPIRPGRDGALCPGPGPFSLRQATARAGSGTPSKKCGLRPAPRRGTGAKRQSCSTPASTGNATASGAGLQQATTGVPRLSLRLRQCFLGRGPGDGTDDAPPGLAARRNPLCRQSAG